MHTDTKLFEDAELEFQLDALMDDDPDAATPQVSSGVLALAAFVEKSRANPSSSRGPSPHPPTPRLTCLLLAPCNLIRHSSNARRSRTTATRCPTAVCSTDRARVHNSGAAGTPGWQPTPPRIGPVNDSHSRPPHGPFKFCANSEKFSVACFAVLVE